MQTFAIFVIIRCYVSYNRVSSTDKRRSHCQTS